MDTNHLIIDYESAEDRFALVTSDYETKRRAILAAVKDELDALAAEFAPIMAAAGGSREAARAAAIDAVKAEGKTVKGARLMFVWTKGRAGGYDAKMLDGYSAAHPEILAFKKPDGEPSVAIRTV